MCHISFCSIHIPLRWADDVAILHSLPVSCFSDLSFRVLTIVFRNLIYTRRHRPTAFAQTEENLNYLFEFDNVLTYEIQKYVHVYTCLICDIPTMEPPLPLILRKFRKWGKCASWPEVR